MLGWWWGVGRVAVHEHQGLSKRAELISVGEGRAGRMEGDAAEGASTLEGRRVRSGWLATCPDDISTFMSLWLCLRFLWCEWVGVFLFLFFFAYGGMGVWTIFYFFLN